MEKVNTPATNAGAVQGEVAVKIGRDKTVDQSAVVAWYYKSNTRRQTPLVTVREPDSRHGTPQQ